MANDTAADTKRTELAAKRWPGERMFWCSRLSLQETNASIYGIFREQHLVHSQTSYPPQLPPQTLQHINPFTPTHMRRNELRGYERS